MLSLVTKDRERLSHKLAAETQARKKVELEKRELERRIKLGSATSQLEARKTRDVADALLRKKDEMAEIRSMLAHQTLEAERLATACASKDKRIASLEKKMSAYDDSFYSLEARNVRDRTRMEEMAKAKLKAEDEKNIFRHMLEQAHERSLKERHELRRDAQAKIESSSSRIRAKKARIAELEKELLERRQVEEEKNQYREQCSALMEQCSSLMEQLSAAHAGVGVGGGGIDASALGPRVGDGAPPPPGPPPREKRSSLRSPAASSILDRVKSGVKQGVAVAHAAAKGGGGGGGGGDGAASSSEGRTDAADVS